MTLIEVMAVVASYNLMSLPEELFFFNNSLSVQTELDKGAQPGLFSFWGGRGSMRENAHELKLKPLKSILPNCSRLVTVPKYVL